MLIKNMYFTPKNYYFRNIIPE